MPLHFRFAIFCQNLSGELLVARSMGVGVWAVGGAGDCGEGDGGGGECAGSD